MTRHDAIISAIKLGSQRYQTSDRTNDVSPRLSCYSPRSMDPFILPGGDFSFFGDRVE